MKQTAVEWLVEQFDTTINYTLEEYQLKIQQAKAMEKEQIIRAHSSGWNSGVSNKIISSYEYYRNIFKSK